MKKLHGFRRGVAAVLAILTTVTSVQMPAYAQTNQVRSTGEIKVDSQLHYQTLEGWGTSLCWWGNVIGSAGDRDYNGNGKPDREEIAELAFSPEYLNLNIVRYNVGGGDKADSTIKRVEGKVPGWSKDMFGNDDGSGEFLGDAFYQKSSEEMNDAGQIWMLEQANQWRQEKGDIINKVFSNSPPYYMTKSGTSTGASWADDENLRWEDYGRFTQYLARATKWLDQNLNEKFGAGIDYVEPLNEPDTDYWHEGSTKQEGCIFRPGESQIRIYQAMKQALAAEGLTDVNMTGTDETSLDKSIWSYEHLDTQTRGDLDVISVHTYGGNDTERVRLKDMAASYDKGLWMSEVTKGGGDVHNEWAHGNMGQCQTQSQSEGIMSDLKKMQSSAWIAWLVADSEYECIQTNQNWGLIHYVFEEDGPVKDYHTNLVNEDGSKKDDVPDAGYWAVTKQFYTMMQYSKYLKAGYTMIDIGDDNMCAAVSPDRKELVIVAQNFSGNTRNTSVDLSEFPNAADVKLYRTSDNENCEEVGAFMSDGVLDVSMPEGYTVSTYVITGDGSPLYEETSYKTFVDSNVEATEDALAAGASDMDKFTYTGYWGDGWEWGKQEKYTTEKSATATFKFDGVQASLFGKMSGNGADLLIQVDGGEAQLVNTRQDWESRGTHLYTTPVLADGEHTVTIRMAEEQTVGSPEIVLEYAEIVHGVLPVEDTGYTKEDLVNQDYVLYMVNCGTPDPAVIPNPDQEKLGLLQSNVDQPYGKDAVTGNEWGRDADTEYAKTVNYEDDGSDIGNSFIYMADNITFDAEKSRLGYSFEMPQKKLSGISSDTYEVTVAFKNPWDWRKVDISLEGVDVAADIGIGQWEWVSRTFTTTVTDGVLNVQVKNPDRNGSHEDPILNYIKVRAVEAAEPEITYSISGTVKAARGAAVEGIEVKLYEGEDISQAEPIAAAKTDATGTYVFNGLGKGVYCVELPATEDYEAIVQKVELAESDIKDINFTLSSSGSEELPYTKEDLVNNNFVLYTVNCGTPDPTVVPNADTEKMGLLQSNVDQAHGKDEKTGMTWGRDADTEYSKAWNHGDDAYDIGNSFVYMAEDVTFDKDKSRLGYSFELPQGELEGVVSDTYEVTVAFKHRWDEREVNICLEGKTVAIGTKLGYDQWVSQTFITEVTDGQLNVEIKNPNRWSSKQDPLLNFIKVRALEQSEVVYDSITGTRGDQMYDTEGKIIQAHGGQIQQLTVEGETKWYWIGEDKTYDYRPVGGIHVYSSDDLYNWKDEGVVLRTMENMEQFESDPYFEDLYGDYTEEKKEEIFIDLDKFNCVMERPKMIYNEKNDNYVIWFHADGRTPWSDADYGKAKAGVAVSDSPAGPFKLLGSYKLNYHDDQWADHGYDGWDGRGSVRDINVFVDDDKTAYVIYSSEGNRTTFISRLNDDYTALEVDRDEAVENEHFTRNFIGWSREAPAMFKYNDKYYIINSGCTGWSPNPAEYAVADHPMGPWTAMGDPCSGWEQDTTFRTQSTCVFPVDAEKGKYIYMGDRWNAGYLRDSRYVWIPVNFQEEGKLKLERYDDWKLEDLDYKGLPRITSELPTRFESLEEMEKALPDTIDVGIGEEEILDAAVTWDAIDTEKAFSGTYKVNGWLTDKGRSVSLKADIVDQDTLYFFDSGADSSDYLETLKDVAKGLRNDVADQAYTSENGAGYLGTKGEDFGKRVGHGVFGNGWWAEEGKAIEYRFDLEPGSYTITTGYQEWWNAGRNLKVSAVLQSPDQNEVKLSEKDFTLKGDETGMVQELDITVPETQGNQGTVVVRIEKTGGSDAVLAFIGISSAQAQETTYKISGTVKAKQDDVVAEDIELKLYEGEDITLASPSDAVRTDAEGAYVFENLEAGVYSVELPAADDYEAAVKTVVIEDGDVTDVNFTLGSDGEEPEVRRIKITALPEKTKYMIGEALELSGLEVTLFETDGSERILEEEEYEVSELDSTTAGTKTIKVTCEQEGEIYAASFKVIVYKKADASIKVVKEPDKKTYFAGEEIDLAGMEVRGRNIGEEEVLELSEGDYEVEYDFTEPGTAVVTVVYTMEEDMDEDAEEVDEVDADAEDVDEVDEDAADADAEKSDAEKSDAGNADAADVDANTETAMEEKTGLQLKDTFEVRVLEEEAELYVKEIKITKKPYLTVYEVDSAFDPEGMVVEKTVAVTTSAGNTTHKEIIPLEDLDFETDEFSEAGNKKIVVSYSAEGKDGTEVTLSDILVVTVTKSSIAKAEGELEAAYKQLEDALALKDYMTENERQEAFGQALDSMEQCLERITGSSKVSEKAFGVLKKLEEQVLEAHPHITSSVQADKEFAGVKADGLALSADLASSEAQEMKLKLQKSQEELPSHMKDGVDGYMMMEITLHGDDENNEMQPRLPIKITMDIPVGVSGENLVLYHFHNGEWKTIYPVVRGKQMSFIVSDLSLFVAANTKTPSNPGVSGGNRGGGSSYGNSKGGPGYTTPGTWKRDASGWWYQKTDGSYIHSSWVRINGLWYYFDNNGYMKTGWLFDRGNWYYLNADGSMAAATWILSTDKWYYLTDTGAMAVNAATPDGFRVGADGGLVK